MDAQAVPNTFNEVLFDQLTELKGWTTDVQRAAGIGVSHTTIGRIRGGLTKPGQVFITKTMAALADLPMPVKLDELFPSNTPGEAYIERIKALVKNRPPLDDDQRAHIAMLLNPLVETTPAKAEVAA